MSKGTLYDHFETDEKTESEEGIHIEIPQTGSKFWFKRAGGANVAFTKYIERESRKQRVGGKEMTSEIAEPVLAAGLAHHCVYKWESVTDRQGNEIPFSPEACIELFTDLPTVMLIIHQQASNPDNFLSSENVMEEEAGN